MHTPRTNKNVQTTNPVHADVCQLRERLTKLRQREKERERARLSQDRERKRQK